MASAPSLLGHVPLSSVARQWLLAQARATIAHHLGLPSEPLPPEAAPVGAHAERGCFVSLHRKNGDLRGCIGTFESRPLWEAVREMAVAAATRDPRFRPVGSDELGDCVIEISALTPPAPAHAEDVQVGVHGVTVARGLHRGVLLPQVASEHGWDRDTFLDHTCAKAGLPAGAWRDGSVAIEVFTAEVFGEDPAG